MSIGFGVEFDWIWIGLDCGDQDASIDCDWIDWTDGVGLANLLACTDLFGYGDLIGWIDFGLSVLNGLIGLRGLMCDD